MVYKAELVTLVYSLASLPRATWLSNYFVTSYQTKNLLFSSVVYILCASSVSQKVKCNFFHLSYGETVKRVISLWICVWFHKIIVHRIDISHLIKMLTGKTWNYWTNHLKQYPSKLTAVKTKIINLIDSKKLYNRCRLIYVQLS